MIEKGMKIKGVFSGKYLGTVIGIFKDQVVVCSPDKTVFTISALMVEPVPLLNADGKPRVWAGA